MVGFSPIKTEGANAKKKNNIKMAKCETVLGAGGTHAYIWVRMRVCTCAIGEQDATLQQEGTQGGAGGAAGMGG